MKVDENLIKKARTVLENNWMGSYTKPSSQLYPHQWSWDSGFISIGYSTYNQKRAQLELMSLLKGQWENGMIPHIVYNPRVSGEYFPDPELWDTRESETAPPNVLTSGITQPPIHAISALYIQKRAKDPDSSVEFLRGIYPKLLASHRFFYEERDPKDEGLVYIRHPWESGLDNSPTWDVPLKRIELEGLPMPERKDLKKGIPLEQRPMDSDYVRYVYLVELFKENHYRERDIFKKCPFLVQDPLINSMLLKADEALSEIGEILGENTSKIRDRIEKTKKSINKKLWHKGHGFYDAYDLKADKMIEVDTAAGFSPLFAGAPTDEQAKRLFDYLDSASFCNMHGKKCFSIPNYNMEGELFDPQNYWRGPIWINMNWMVFQGLRRYGFDEKAKSVMEDIIELVKRYGFYEYYDPIQGSGYGSKDFSWTAALFLDTLYRMKK